LAAARRLVFHKADAFFQLGIIFDGFIQDGEDRLGVMVALGLAELAA
jgi:hypothetical protein